jgi:hypothetical protein
MTSKRFSHEVKFSRTRTASEIDLSFVSLPHNMTTRPRNKLYLSVDNLICTANKKLGLVKDTFGVDSEVYLNLNDQIAQVSIACLINLLNKNGFNIHVFNHFENIIGFKMSDDTLEKYKTNRTIIRANKAIEESNHLGHRSHQSNNSGGCYIATMVYGDYDHPKVRILRNFRDNFLDHYKLGKSFIKFYYRYSPGWVRMLEDNGFFNKSIKKILNLLIKIFN